MVNPDHLMKEHTVNKIKAAATLTALATTMALAVGLSSCATQPPPPPTQENRSVYLKLVRDNTASKATDTELVRVAETACAAMRAGASFSDLGREVIASGISRAAREDTYKVIGYGLSQYCPEVSK